MYFTNTENPKLQISGLKKKKKILRRKNKATEIWTGSFDNIDSVVTALCSLVLLGWWWQLNLCCRNVANFCGYIFSSAIFVPYLLCSESLIFLFHFNRTFNHVLIGAMWFHSTRKSEIYKNCDFSCVFVQSDSVPTTRSSWFHRLMTCANHILIVSCFYCAIYVINSFFFANAPYSNRNCG